ncbi:MAG: NADH-quinone oxidoreductase subunit C [Actinomycetota bacterium]|nr:NADH-quinone oxidoreductase subunit C [Actinomycetota bacterium]
MTVPELIDARELRTALTGTLESGARFVGAWATADGGWRVALATVQGTRVLVCTPAGGRVDSIVQTVGAAVWDEREAHDLYGLEFDGHEPLRTLVDHSAALEAWTTPVRGGGVHQVAVGPIHAGVIESGHFRFHCVGDRILALDPRLFYKHRGLERAAEGRGYGQALPYAARACAACSVANTVAYAQAVEDAVGLWPPAELRRQRTLLLELERAYNHLNDIGAVCAGVGFAPGSMAFAVLKDRAQELCRQAFGHRFLFGAVAVGHGPATLDAAQADALRAQLRELRADAAAAWRDLEFSASLQARLDGVGVLSHDRALQFGAVGPAARASGVVRDVRTDSPRLAYMGFVPASLPQAGGDVAARFQIRAAELEATWELLDGLLSEPLTRSAATWQEPGGGVGVGRVESPRGETVCMVELAAGRVARLHLRSASYANWPALADATAGNLLPDFPLINKSFELCYACVDR